ncbi:MAG: hypothetical protein PHI88_02300 [Candidatus Pacebacteria bacterium]|nr:hypothetical protein [Candidatus Paceibacterota bacterium]
MCGIFKNLNWQAIGAIGTFATALAAFIAIEGDILLKRGERKREFSKEVIFPLWTDIERIKNKIQEECFVDKWDWQDEIDKKYAYLTYDPIFRKIKKKINRFHYGALSKGQRLKNDKNNYDQIVKIVRSKISENEDLKDEIGEPIEKIRVGLLIGDEKVEISFFRLIYEGGYKNGTVKVATIKNVKDKEKDKKNKQQNRKVKSGDWNFENKEGELISVKDKNKCMNEIRNNIEKELQKKENKGIINYINQCQKIFEEGDKLIERFKNFKIN